MLRVSSQLGSKCLGLALGLLIVLTGAFAPVPAAAQPTTAAPAAGATPTPAATTPEPATPPAPTQSAGSRPDGGSDGAGSNDRCGLTDIPACGAALIKVVALFFLTLSAVFLGVVGMLFNWTIYITVFQFGNLFGNNEGLLAAWGVLRDIGNIFLLFGFIFMGVSTILNLPGNEFTAKKALPSLIIFAILLNFSLFAAEAVVDVSNGLATSFYNQAGNGLCPPAIDAYHCAINYGIGGTLLQLSGVSRVFDRSTANQFEADTGSVAISIIGLTIFVATMAMVLLAAVFMFISRAVTLVLLMTVSPIGFAGMAIPPMQKYAKMWWEQLLKQAFFAPVYILLVLISLKFMQGIGEALAPAGSNMTLAQAFTAGEVSNLALVFIFVLLIGFLVMATQAAKSMGAVGAAASTKWAGAAVFGGMARISNAGVGGLSSLGQRASRNLTNVAARRIPETNPRLRALALGATTGATSFFRAGTNVNTDIRRLPGVGAALQKFGGVGGPAEHASYADMQHQRHQISEGMQKSRQQSMNEARRVRLQEELRQAARTPGYQLSDESERFLAGLSAAQIAADHALLEAIERAADRLSSEQFEGLMKDDKVSDTIKAELAEVRFAEQHRIGQRFAANPATAWQDSDRDLVRRMTKKDLALLAKYRGADFAQLMQVTNATGDTLTSGGQNEYLEDNEGLTRRQRDTTRSSTRRGKVSTLAATAPAAGTPEAARLARYATALSPKEKQKLGGAEILGSQQIMDSLTPDDLREFQREAKFTDQRDRAAILNYIDNIMAPTNPNRAALQAYIRSDQRNIAYWS